MGLVSKRSAKWARSSESSISKRCDACEMCSTRRGCVTRGKSFRLRANAWRPGEAIASSRSGTEMAALAPLEPSNEADLIALIREAAQAKRGLVTEGSGTKAHFGPSARAETQRVSLRALDRVLAYEPGDMVVC